LAIRSPLARKSRSARTLLPRKVIFNPSAHVVKKMTTTLAPDFHLPGAQMFSLDSFASKKAIVLLFFDKRRSEFCKKRLVAFQKVLPGLSKKNIQVIGISVDKGLDQTTKWAAEIGLTFPLLSDVDGTVCKSYGLLNSDKRAAERALVVIKKGKIAFREIVTGTEVPLEVLKLLR
jgi:peroxiredoxin